MRPFEMKKCWYCSGESDRRIILESTTKELQTAYLTMSYAGMTYPICKKCGDVWNKKLNALLAEHKKKVDSLFEYMIASKGEFSERKEIAGQQPT